MSTEYPSPNDPRQPAGWASPPPSYPPPSSPWPPPAGAGGGRPPRRGPRIAIAVVAGVALLAVGGGVGGYAGSRLIGSSSSNAPIQVSPQGNGSSDVQSAASKVKPAIVDINTTVASARGTAKAAG